MDQALINLAAAAPELIFGVLIALVCIYLFRTMESFMRERDNVWTKALDARELAGQQARDERDERWRVFFDMQREKDRTATEQMLNTMGRNSDQTVQALAALTDRIRLNTEVLTRHDEEAQSLHTTMYALTQKAIGKRIVVPTPRRREAK